MFHSDEEIILSLSTSEYPWDDMNHRSYFLPKDVLLLKNPFDQYAVETKE